jgi:hypothetical protein
MSTVQVIEDGMHELEDGDLQHLQKSITISLDSMDLCDRPTKEAKTESSFQKTTIEAINSADNTAIQNFASMP